MNPEGISLPLWGKVNFFKCAKTQNHKGGFEMTYRIDVNAVREAARGHWDAIFCALAPTFKAAMQRPGKHVPCPVHGGKDGFRLFPDYEQTGSCVCNTCGTFHDGFAALEWLHGWGFAETLEKVARVLGLNPSCEEEVLERERLDRVYRGIVLGMNESKLEADVYEGFVVLIEDEISGSVRRLGTRSLQAVLAAATVKAYERVEIVLAARERIRRRSGRVLTRYIWSVKRLMAKDEEARFAAQEALYNRRLAEAITDCWQRARRLDPRDFRQKPLLAYLESRRIADSDLRFFEDIRFENGVLDPETKRWFPAMTAAVRDANGRLVTLHRTLLSSFGTKADVAAPKRLMKLPQGRTISGCAIHIGETGEVLALAEGIETALSVAISTNIPCWACICAHGLEVVEIPQTVREVLIFADKDRSNTGQCSAQKLAQRLQADGLTVRVMSIREEIPDAAKGIDCNDLLCRFGKERLASMVV